MALETVKLDPGCNMNQVQRAVMHFLLQIELQLHAMTKEGTELTGRNGQKLG